jgi:hypothetical protein
LKARARQWIDVTVPRKNPLRLRFSFAVWTRAMVAAPIERKFIIAPVANSVGRCWRKSASPVATSLHRAIERDESLVRQWLDGSAGSREDPEIKAIAKKRAADIYFGDAAHLRSDDQAGRGSGAKGDTPIVQATGARHGMSLISRRSPRAATCG